MWNIIDDWQICHFGRLKRNGLQSTYLRNIVTEIFKRKKIYGLWLDKET